MVVVVAGARLQYKTPIAIEALNEIGLAYIVIHNRMAERTAAAVALHALGGDFNDFRGVRVQRSGHGGVEQSVIA